MHARVDGKMKRRPGSAIFDTKLKMALDLRRQVTEIVGAAAVNLAETLVRQAAEATTSMGTAAADSELSQTELRWLHDWFDEQLEPNMVTKEMADAALAEYRKEVAGGSAAAVDGFAHIKATQLKLAQHRAA